MALGAYGHVLRAELQLGGWYQLLPGQKEEVSSDEPLEGEEGVIQKPLLEVETKPRHYTRAPGNYTRDARPK